MSDNKQAAANAKMYQEAADRLSKIMGAEVKLLPPQSGVSDLVIEVPGGIKAVNALVDKLIDVRDKKLKISKDDLGFKESEVDGGKTGRITIEASQLLDIQVKDEQVIAKGMNEAMFKKLESQSEAFQKATKAAGLEPPSKEVPIGTQRKFAEAISDTDLNKKDHDKVMGMANKAIKNKAINESLQEAASASTGLNKLKDAIGGDSADFSFKRDKDGNITSAEYEKDGKKYTIGKSDINALNAAENKRAKALKQVEAAVDKLFPDATKVDKELVNTMLKTSLTVKELQAVPLDKAAEQDKSEDKEQASAAGMSIGEAIAALQNQGRTLDNPSATPPAVALSANAPSMTGGVSKGKAEGTGVA